MPNAHAEQLPRLQFRPVSLNNSTLTRVSFAGRGIQGFGESISLFAWLISSVHRHEASAIPNLTLPSLFTWLRKLPLIGFDCHPDLQLALPNKYEKLSNCPQNCHCQPFSLVTKNSFCIFSHFSFQVGSGLGLKCGTYIYIFYAKTLFYFLGQGRAAKRFIIETDGKHSRWANWVCISFITWSIDGLIKCIALVYVYLAYNSESDIELGNHFEIIRHSWQTLCVGGLSINVIYAYPSWQWSKLDNTLKHSCTAEN